MREAFGERAQRGTEWESAEDALTLAGQFGEEGLEVVRADTLDHAVAIVQDERPDVGDIDGPVA